MKKKNRFKILALLLACMMFLESPLVSMAEEHLVRQTSYQPGVSQAEESGEASEASENNDLSEAETPNDNTDEDTPGDGTSEKETGENTSGSNTGEEEAGENPSEEGAGEGSADENVPGDGSTGDGTGENPSGGGTSENGTGEGDSGSENTGNEPEEGNAGDKAPDSEPGENPSDQNQAENPTEDPAGEDNGQAQEKVLALSCADRTKEGITLSFPLEEEIKKYEIYRQNNDAQEELIETLTDLETEEGKDYLYIDKTAVEPCSYTYRLQGYTQSGEEFVSAGQSELLTVEYDTKLYPALLIPDVPEDLKIISLDENSLELTWKKQDNTAGYELYRAEAENGVYDCVATLGPEDTSYIDTDLSFLKEYWYKLRAFNVSNAKVNIYSDYTAPSKSMVRPGAVRELTAQSTRYNTIQLTWDKIKGAKGYEIYYADSLGGEYRLLKTLTRNTYKYTKALCGTTYYFKVRSYQREGWELVYGEMSEAVYASTTLAQPEPYVSKTTYNCVTLKWPKVTGSTSYRIQMAETAEGPFTELSTVKRNSYSHKKLETGKAYYYKVAAYRKDYGSQESEVISAVPDFETLSGLKGTGTTTSRIKVTWKRVVGIEEYVVVRYRSESDAKAGRDKKKTITTKSVSCTDKGLAEDTTYWYTVYGRRGDYSTKVVGPVSAKTKKSSGGSGGVAYGIDVASYQGNIDWKAVKDDGIDFAMIRILVKNGSKDSKFERNYDNAREAGVKVGVYRYSYAQSVHEAREEAREVIDALDGRKLDYPIALDMEDSSQHHISSSTKTDMILAYKKIVEDAGYKFILYANTDWLRNRIDMSRLSNVDVWIARWRSLSLGHGYTGQGKVNMWQYSDSGEVAGISGKVDLDYCYKSY